MIDKNHQSAPILSSATSAEPRELAGSELPMAGQAPAYIKVIGDILEQREAILARERPALSRSPPPPLYLR